ncbi:MAG: c-type cytochrome [Verrucomicrobiaceae bacterium]|nr:MAG: c-type cytochrome [Verrucomicrobiaceae bacterium]
MIKRIAIIFFISLIIIKSDADETFPKVSDDFNVALFAQEPLVRNPCAITFDKLGRLCVGMGPQYRKPKPETEGDSVWIILDKNGDGSADSRIEFASGFNSIQGLAWKGNDLWVANAPDLTLVRDTNNDDIGDEYVKVYTDLGNLEHGLHGLNFGPDGKLYMSKGNSKGLTILPEKIAPQPFRELWGISTPKNTPSFPAPVLSNRKNYNKSYHHPADDWGITGGILRCDDDGKNLEIISRGFRNPWDICFDDEFNWLGTDNDQTMGDKIFAPFFGAHFGWGHSWSYDWKGDYHLPTAPSSGPLFEGSGTGIIFCNIADYPKKYRNVFFINDWLNREVYIFKPEWKGAWRFSESQNLVSLASAGTGRSMPLSKGRSFDPVDIELGPDRSIWISSWGRQYGAHYENGSLANEGRIYRLWPKIFKPVKEQLKKRSENIQDWSFKELLKDLGSHLPAWRTNAQDELIRRGDQSLGILEKTLKENTQNKSLETWATWAIGRIKKNPNLPEETLNQKIQSIRIQTHNKIIHPNFNKYLNDSNARVRNEAVIAIRQLKEKKFTAHLKSLAEKEKDRIVFYSVWGALMDLCTVEELKHQINEKSPGLKLSALLALLEKDTLPSKLIERLCSNLVFTEGQDPRIVKIAVRRSKGKAVFESRGRPLTAEGLTPTKFHSTTINPFSNLKPSTENNYAVDTLEIGKKIYTDRNYLLRKIPAQLKNDIFIKTACADAEYSKGFQLTFNLKYPSTLFLIDDSRAEQLPEWANSDWKETNLIIKTDDPKEMKVFQKDFPAGIVKLGPNRQGVNSRKGNYLIAAKPKLLSNKNEITTVKSVIESLSFADAVKGEDLFMSIYGANCSSCHQVSGKGKNHAPDLSNIGNRADPKILAEAILNPSQSITEGFAAQMFKLKSGIIHTGIVLEETGREIKLAMTGGAVVSIQRNEIIERKGLPISAMPASFAELLNPKEVAHIIAYLSDQTKANIKKPEESRSFNFERNNADKLTINLGKQPIATYLIDDPILTRRGLINIKSPSGIPITRPFPAPKNEDHSNMHPGIWLSYGWIDGNDYWRLKSKVKFENFLQEPTSNKKNALFSVRNRYLNEDSTETVCIEDSTYNFSLHPKGVLLEISATYFNDEREFAFGDQEESGLALRMAKSLTVEFGKGRILNNTGDLNGKGTWGKPFKWIDYSGIHDEKRIGLLLIPSNKNKMESWAHSRDYGVLVANPFPKQPQERREPYVKTLIKKGEKLKMQYRVLIHENQKGQFDPKRIADHLLNQ